MRISTALSAAVVVSALATPALAEYPERPVLVIIPFSAGGGTDIGGRTMIPYLEKCLGQPVVPVNRPGAGATIGIQEVVNAAPDGYTFGIMNSPNFVRGAITKPDVQYDLESVEWLGNFYGNSGTVAVRKDSEIETIGQFAEKLKAGETINIGISSPGSDDSLLIEGLKKQLGVDIEPIPLGGSAESRNGLLGGHVDAIIMSGTDALRFSENIRPLAIATPERVSYLPDTPTFRESGIELLGVSNHTMGAPKGLPPEVHEKLAGCLETVANDPAFLADAKERSANVMFLNDEQTTEHIQSLGAEVQSLWEADPW